MELYHNAMSVCAQKVRLVLAEMGLAPTLHHLDLRAGDAHRPDYLALNPNGVVPVPSIDTALNDGAFLVGNAWALDPVPADCHRPEQGPASYHERDSFPSDSGRTETSLADAAMLPYVVRLQMLGMGWLWDERPRVSDWLARCQARPGYAAIRDHEPAPYVATMATHAATEAARVRAVLA